MTILATAKRRKARTVATVAGIAVGVGTLFALLSAGAGIEQALAGALGNLGAHILVLPEGCPYALTLALLQGVDTMEYIPEDMLHRIRGTANVKLAVPVVVGKAKINGELVSIYGTTEEVLQVKPWGIRGVEGAVVGSEIARRLGLARGTAITLSLYADENLFVQHVLPATGGRDDTFVFVPLAVAQRVLGLERGLSAVLVQAANLAEVANTRHTLSRLENVQAVPPSEVFDMLVGLFGSIKSNLMLITGIAIAVAVLTTLNTMTMAVYERKKDIGLLRAVGATRRDVFALFMRESLVFSLFSGAVGILAGYGATHLLPRTTGFGLETSPAFSLAHVGVCLLVAGAVGTVGGLYPAMSAARVQPITALREP